MNKNDVQLIVVLLVFSLISIVFIKTNKKNGDIFKIYYENDIILEEKLSKDNIYEVEGYNGKVKVEHFGRLGGIVPDPDEIVTALEEKIIK